MGIFDMFKKEKQKTSARVTATIPSGRTMYRFRALEDFWSDVFRSQYSKGLVYNVREGNTKLALAVADWVPQGKVEVL